jgi:hypothetical protein
MLSVGSLKILTFILDVVKTRRKDKVYLFLLFGGEGANLSVLWGFVGVNMHLMFFFWHRLRNPLFWAK